MLRKFAMLIVCLSMLLPLSGPLQAQDSLVPIYVRYCDAERQTIGDDTLRAAFDEVETQLQAVEDFLARFEAGTLTFIEGIALAEEAQTNWDNTTKIDCMAPLNTDVQRTMAEVLISMLYGQMVDGDSSERHLFIAEDLIATIRLQSQAARSYLDQPVEVAQEPDEQAPPAEEAPVEEDSAEEDAAPETEEDARTTEGLTAELTNYLTNNGVTVLIDAAVQPFPDSTLIVVRLNRFEANGQFFDVENSLFTMDVIAEAIADWPEVAALISVVVETYDDSNQRVLFAEATGEDFRNHYFDNTLPRDQFVDTLNLDPAPEGN
ncbi:MAG: hypothetical protein ACLFTK_11425 [Anaerolineales bacterium]